MNKIDVFMLWFLAAEAIFIVSQLPFRNKTLRPVFRVLLIVGKLLLGILFAFLVMAGPVQLRVLQPLMMALYVALLADAAADAVYTIFKTVKKTNRVFLHERIIGAVCGALFLLYGMVNMQVVVPKYHTYTSDKLKSEHTVVFLGDMHVDSGQPFSVTRKTVETIKAQDPDVTILGGDIVDDYTSAEDMKRTFKLFADFDTPVYFIYGNHDRQGHAEFAGGSKFTPEELESALKENGVILLKDEFARIAPDLLLLGREDISEGEGRADISSLINPSPDSYLIVADHQPVEFKQNVGAGADLQLSAHTHAGQMFPLGALYSVIGYCYGDYEQDGAVMNVSAGASGWRMPLRTSARCNIEVITLKPE